MVLTSSKAAWVGGQSQGTLSTYPRISLPPSHRLSSPLFIPATTPSWGISEGSTSSRPIKLGEFGRADAKKTVAERRRAVWKSLKVIASCLARERKAGGERVRTREFKAIRSTRCVIHLMIKVRAPSNPTVAVPPLVSQQLSIK
jgi:hypothetical protein